MQEPKQNSDNPWLRPAMIFLVKISGYIITTALVSILGGQYIDSYFRTSPYITILLVILGITFSIFGILREIKHYQKLV